MPTYSSPYWPHAYSDINTGVVARRLRAPDTERTGLYWFLHRTVGLANYTHRQFDEPAYTIVRADDAYDLTAHWLATPTKAAALLAYSEQLRAGQAPDPGNPEWRQAVVRYLRELLAQPIELTLISSPSLIGGHQVSLRACVPAAALAALDRPPADAVVSLPPPPPRRVPHALIAAVIGEHLAAVGRLYGRDHAALLAQLEPLTGHDATANALIGFTYYLYLDQPKRAYAYLRRAADNADQLPARLVPWVLDFAGTIEFSHLLQATPAEATLVQSLQAGNGYAVLKLAYLYLCRPTAANRPVAAQLARHGELMLRHAPTATATDPEWAHLPPHDAAHRTAGHHIVASVYLWNREVASAARVHGRFLADTAWCAQYPALVEGYLLLAGALPDATFLANIITDYPVVREQFGPILRAWHYTAHPDEDGFTSALIPWINKLNAARRLYFSQ